VDNLRPLERGSTEKNSSECQKNAKVRLAAYPRQNALARALREIGCLERTLFILDWISGQAAQLKRELGASDKARLNDYFENIREIERRIQRVEARNASGEQRALPEAPIGVPDSFEEHVHILMDLIALAFASDSTRVFSFKLGRDASKRPLTPTAERVELALSEPAPAVTPATAAIAATPATEVTAPAAATCSPTLRSFARRHRLNRPLPPG